MSSNKKCTCNEPYDFDRFGGVYPYCPVHDNKNNMENNNTLPAEAQEQIKKDADQKFPFRWPKNKQGEDIVQRPGQNPVGWRKHQNVVNAYITGATEWAIWKVRYDELKQEFDALNESTAKTTKFMVDGSEKLHQQIDYLKHDNEELRGDNKTISDLNAALVKENEKMAEVLSYAMQTIQFADGHLDVPKPYVESWGNDYMNTIAAIEEALSIYKAEEKEAENYATPVHDWFELSYAQYLTVPRSVMEAMPVEWQKRMVQCLEQLDDTIDWRPKEGRYWVKLKDDKGRYIRDPLMEYRHPLPGVVVFKDQGLTGKKEVDNG